MTSAVVSQLVVYGILGLVGWVGAKLHTAATATKTPTPTPATPTPAATPVVTPAVTPSTATTLLTTIESALQSHVGSVAVSLVESAAISAVEKKMNLPAGTLTNIVNASQTPATATSLAPSASSAVGALPGGEGVVIPINAAAHVAVKAAA